MIKRIVAACIFIFFPFTLPAYAGPPLDAVQSEVNRVLEILRQKDLREEVKKEQLEAIYRQMFDEVELARRTLARNWGKLNPAQQQEFVDLYRRVLEKAYINKILSYTNEKVVFSKENMLSQDRAEVLTKIITSTKEIPITYRVIQKDNIWKVYDVVVENVSLVQNYRSQFNAILANRTPEQMLEILQKKVQGQQS